MRSFTARSLALAALVPALLLFVLVPGCAKQSEGERCGDDGSLGVAASDDCGDGLTCTVSANLLSGLTDKTNRCCYTNGSVTDSRCEPSANMTAAGGAKNGGAGGASAGTAGGGAAGSGVAAGGSIATEAGASGEGS